MTIPTGFVLVPVDPTEEMIKAAARSLDVWRESAGGDPQRKAAPDEKHVIRYKAMLAASPAAASAEGETGTSDIVGRLRAVAEAWTIQGKTHLAIQAAARIEILETLVREVNGGPDTYAFGKEGWKQAETLFSRLAESGWFKRAKAALKQSTPPLFPDQSAARIEELTTALEKIEAGAARGRPSDLEAAKLDLITILKIARDALAIPSTDRGG